MQRRQATRTLQSIENLLSLFPGGGLLARTCTVCLALRDPVCASKQTLWGMHGGPFLSMLTVDYVSFSHHCLPIQGVCSAGEGVSVLANSFAAMHRGCCLIRATELLLIDQEATEEVAAFPKDTHGMSTHCGGDAAHTRPCAASTRGCCDTTQTQSDMQPLLTHPS